MNLPTINARNTKKTQKKSILQEYGSASMQQFGLGIQVFKIQSNKLIDGDKSKQRKMIKNIQNPVVVKPVISSVKKNPKLPSLSSEKYQKLSQPGNLNQTFNERRTTIQKKKQPKLFEQIKQYEQKKKIITKKSTSVGQHAFRDVPLEQTVIVREKQKTQQHFISSMNDLKNFYESFEKRQAQNLREIKKLKKLKQNENDDLLAKQLRLRQNKKQMVLDMLQRQKFTYFDQEDQYQEFDITRYMQNGKQKFTFYDQVQVVQY